MAGNYMIKKMLMLVGIVLLLPHCAVRKSKPPRKFTEIQEQTKLDLGHEVNWQETVHSPLTDELLDQLAQGISSDDAARIALLNNASLQAKFEDLGIAKADLMKAGVYSNPAFNGLFWLPLQGAPNNQSGIEANFYWTISELWQVPLRKKVAQDQLEIITQEIMQTILETYSSAKKAYIDCLFTNAQIDNAQKVSDQSGIYYNDINYRQEFGFSSEFSIDTATIMTTQFETELIRSKAEQRNALIALQTLFALDPNPISIQFTEQLSYTPITLPDITTLEQLALEHRKELIIAHLKVQQAEHKLRLEKGRIFDQVQGGFTILKNFDGTRGIGPAVNVQIPIFNFNYASIEHAHAQIDKAKKGEQAIKRNVLQQLHMAFNTNTALTQEIELYIRMFPAYENAMKYARHYNKTMQLNELVYIQTHMDYYNAKKKLLDAYRKVAQACVDLELAIGKPLTELTC